jgi:hypothetical protein
MITDGRTKDQNSADNDKRDGYWTLHRDNVEPTFLFKERNVESQFQALKIETTQAPPSFSFFAGVQKPSSFIHTPSGTGLGNFDGLQHWQLGFESFPNPDGHIFTRRVLQSFDFVQVIMIELFP